MGKRIIIIIFITSLLLILSLFVNDLYTLWSERIIKTEVYENEEKILTIDFRNNDTFSFCIEGKNDLSCLSTRADFISENVAVFDGKYAFPEMPNYYLKFVFHDDYVEFYNNDEKTLFYKTE